jgi:hypothetical protein
MKDFEPLPKAPLRQNCEGCFRIFERIDAGRGGEIVVNVLAAAVRCKTEARNGVEKIGRSKLMIRVEGCR